MRHAELYIPFPDEPICNRRVSRWYKNISVELKARFLTQDQCKYLANYYKKAGLLRNWRRPYFYQHFATPFTKAIQHLSINKLPCLILDLGCGMGTQSLFFALLGAEVIGLDADPKALSILEKRKVFYEKISCKELKIKIVYDDALSFNYKSIQPITCVFSMFAFNMMQPSSRLIELFSEVCTFDSRLAIQDVNFASWKGRLVKSRRKSKAICPEELLAELAWHNWEVIDQEGGVSIPPIFWKILPNKVLRAIDDKLSSALFFPVSYLTLAKRKFP